jgi:hypothetical protein
MVPVGDIDLLAILGTEKIVPNKNVDWTQFFFYFSFLIIFLKYIFSQKYFLNHANPINTTYKRVASYHDSVAGVTY